MAVCGGKVIDLFGDNRDAWLKLQDVVDLFADSDDDNYHNVTMFERPHVGDHALLSCPWTYWYQVRSSASASFDDNHHFAPAPVCSVSVMFFSVYN